MKRIAILAAAGAPVAVVAALAATGVRRRQTKVVVPCRRCEQDAAAAKTVAVPTGGSITKGGTPKGTCPANSAAGAFNVATGGNWSGTLLHGARDRGHEDPR